MPMLGPGTYDVVVRNASFNGKGDVPQLSIYFEDEMGESITWYHSLGYKKDGTFSEASFKFAADALRNLGWDAEARQYRFEELGAEDSPLIGRHAEIVVQDEVYEGKTRTKVKWINDPTRPRGGAERMEPDAAKSFADRLRTSLGKAAPPAKPKPPAPAKPLNEGPPDDSIPF